MKTFLAIGLWCCFAALPVGAGAAEVGVTDTAVKIGAFVALSGPVAYIGKPEYHGCDSYFKMINDRGGIHGRKIEFIVEDDAYQPPKSVAASKKLVEQDEIFAMAMPTGTATCVAAQPYLLEKGVPVVWPVSASSRFSGKHAKRTWFAVQPRSEDEAALYTRHAVEALHKKRVLAFVQNDDFGKDGLGGVEAEVKRLQKAGKKANLVETVYYNIQDADFSAMVMKMKRAKPDVIIAYSVLRATANLLKAMKSLGLEATVMLNYANVDPVLFQLAGKEAAEGIYSSRYIDIYGKDADPKMQEMLEAKKKYYPSENPENYYYIAGWNIGWVFCEGLKRAGRDLTRESFIKGLESLDKWNGSMLQHVTFGPDRRQGVTSIFLVQARNGVWVKSSDWFSLD